ncbi:calmodulin-like 4, isoform CRA_b [Mus musculus]|nr:calmodulin-like 4, isoform CRA_b [Mus musculus]
MLDFRLQAGVKRTKLSSRSKGSLRMAKFLSQDQINVDDLFKEAGIEPNGQVKYDTFIQRITIPVRDY